MSASEMSNTEQWRETACQAWANSVAARSWFGSQQAAMTQAATEGIIRLGQVKQGRQVLDVATGVGDPALALAKLVGPDGHVQAVDMVNKMLEATEEVVKGQKKRGRQPRVVEPKPSGKAKANVTDPDSRVMKTREGYVQGYNVQAVVSEDQVILAVGVTQEANDVQQFLPMLERMLL